MNLRARNRPPPAGWLLHRPTAPRRSRTRPSSPPLPDPSRSASSPWRSGPSRPRRPPTCRRTPDTLVRAQRRAVGARRPRHGDRHRTPRRRPAWPRRLDAAARAGRQPARGAIPRPRSRPRAPVRAQPGPAGRRPRRQRRTPPASPASLWRAADTRKRLANEAERTAPAWRAAQAKHRQGAPRTSGAQARGAAAGEAGAKSIEGALCRDARAVTRWVAPPPPVRSGARSSSPARSRRPRAPTCWPRSADGPSTLTGVLDARDTALMRAALASLGVAFDRPRRRPRRPVDARRRLHAPAPSTSAWPARSCASSRPWPRWPTGTDAVHRRPRGRGAARRPPAGRAGAGRRPHRRATRCRSPCTAPGRCAGGEATIDASGSSQFVSGLLLSAARFDEGLTLHHRGDRCPRRPHIGLTLAMLRDRGVDAEEVRPDAWRVEPGADRGPRRGHRARPGQRRRLPGRRAADRRRGDRGLAAAHPAGGRHHPGRAGRARRRASTGRPTVR